jgi:hypothetical protein
VSTASLVESKFHTADQLLAESQSSHVVCCDKNLALCGLDMTGSFWVEATEPIDCVVCAELEWPKSLAGCGDPACPYVGAA